MHTFRVEGQKPYVIKNIEEIPTPRLLVFKDRVKRNLEKMKSYLQEIVPDSRFHHLCPHVKTHKSSFIVRMLMDEGINSFKTTMNEIDCAAKCGAQAIFIAYPLLKHDGYRLADFMMQYPKTEFFIQIGSTVHADILRSIAKDREIRWRYFIDIDVGMHRTGIHPKKAFELYSLVSHWPEFEFVGLHGYDGHIHNARFEDRLSEARKTMTSLLKVIQTFRDNRVSIPRVVVAGSITFRLDLEILYDKIEGDTHLLVSPGNWIYWDSGNDELIPGEFEIAAVVLAQVIEVGEGNRITLNLGHKRWGADRGPVDLFSEPGLEVVSFNEEHTMFKFTGDHSFHIGDYVLIVPKHACSTVNLYEHFTVIGEDGEIEILESPVDGRNR